MPRQGWVALFLVLVAVLIVGGFLAVDRLAGEQEDGVVVEKPELGTTPVVRTDLRRVETFPAMVRHAGFRLVISATGGIVTRVPDEGAELVRGESLVEVDGRPVFVFYGERPMWRALRLPPDGSEVEGPDVEQLELNLEALGYPIGSEADRILDDGTVHALRRWQADAGLDESGALELGRIVYVDGPVRVGRSLVELGSVLAPGMPIVEVSETTQEVRLDLPVDRRDRISVGASVGVRLPDDVTAPGTVHDIGMVVFQSVEDRRGVDLVEVAIRLDDPRLGAPYLGFPVDVEIVTDEAVNVLAVPVKALVALSEGGYAVEVETGGEITLVGVDTGMYADGLVEVEGEIAAGDLVRVPK
ncbi:MAG: efflux RND transporter periplasmic adaptor subunit [bacterium]|nr:efflux RND transporter periplasmic adaptor subunit [bacterium]MDE0290124.1 efflux RND transporter periplasmic adaptor subunit [bacterium]MDE0438185.1 efflux RND transporter periplasmic adaptor subunit [bacterium]